MRRIPQNSLEALKQLIIIKSIVGSGIVMNKDKSYEICKVYNLIHALDNERAI